MFKYNLGDRVKDVVTGFVGVVVSRTQFLNKCVRYGVQATTLDKDGRVCSPEHFDEEQLLPEGEAVKLPEALRNKKQTGGPQDAPKRAADIRR